jgi:hypothetical protein
MAGRLKVKPLSIYFESRAHSPEKKRWMYKIRRQTLKDGNFTAIYEPLV